MSGSALASLRIEVAPPLERWYVLIVMCLVYAINIAARYVVTTVFEPIRLELLLTDAGAALLTGVPLAIFYVSCGIPIVWLADRSNRRNIVAASLVLWSGFTVLCGLSQSYWQLLTSRIGVGVGEAGATPPSTSIVSDCFPVERRTMALSVFALEQLVQRRARARCRVAPLGVAAAGSHGILGHLALLPCGADSGCGHETGGWLLERLRRMR